MSNEENTAGIDIHAKLSASISKRWMLNEEKSLFGCPGSILLGSRYPSQGSNLAADTGSAAHYIGEWGLNNARHPTEFKSASPKPYVAVESGGGIVKIDITDELIEGPSMYCETIWSDIERLEDEHLDEGEMFVEERMCINGIFEDGDLEALAIYAAERNIFQLSGMDIDAIGDQYDHKLGDPMLQYCTEQINELFNMFGTNDFSFLIKGAYLGVYDYKNGRYSVEVENNTQFLYYALGSAFAHNWDFEVCEMVVVQPNDSSNPDKVRRWVITKDELAAWIPIFRQAALDTIYKSDIFNPSQDSCHYCPANGGCEAQANARMLDCKADFDDFTDDDVIKLPALGSLSYDDIARVVKNADAIKSFLDGAKNLSYEMMKKDDKEMAAALGMKLVRGKKNRTIKMTENELVEYLEDELLLDKADFMTPGKVLSMGKLEKVVGKDIMKDLVHRPDGGLIMVSQDDEREECTSISNNTAKSDFADAGSDFDDDELD